MDSEPLLAQTTTKPVQNAYFVLGSVFLFIINVQMLLTVQPQWLILRLCEKYSASEPKFINQIIPGLFQSPTINLEPDWDSCRSLPEIQALAAKWAMLISICSSIPSFVSGPFVGAVSDKIGRKPLMFIPLISVFIFTIAYILVEMMDLGLWILLGAAVAIGMLGGFLTMMTIVMSSLADVTDSENRSFIFTLAEALFFAGASVGPFLGGLIARVKINFM
jgi:MFS family permease